MAEFFLRADSFWEDKLAPKQCGHIYWPNAMVRQREIYQEMLNPSSGSNKNPGFVASRVSNEVNLS